MSPIELERYARQVTLPQIGIAGQKNLAGARVLIIGLGGLGCSAAQYLAAAGVGALGLVDHDTVQRSNLHRQILYTENDLGEAKVRVAAQRLHLLNAQCVIESFGEKFVDHSAEEIAASYNILLDCTDNFAARSAVNAYCVYAKKPNVFASLYRFEGTLTVFDGAAHEGCYRCLYADTPESIQNCAEAGVVSMLPGILGAMQALEALKIITGAGKVLKHEVLVYDALLQESRKFRRERNPACVVC